MIDYKELLAAMIAEAKTRHPSDWDMLLSDLQSDSHAHPYAIQIRMAVTHTRLAILEKNTKAANEKRYRLYCALFGRVVNSVYDLTVAELFGFLLVTRGSTGMYRSDAGFTAYMQNLLGGQRVKSK